MGSDFRKKLLFNWEYVALIVVAVLITLGMLGIAQWSGASHSEWPAWVQSIGTVAAILVAVMVPAIQRKHQFVAQRERENEADRARFHALYFMVVELSALALNKDVGHSYQYDCDVTKGCLLDLLGRLNSVTEGNFDQGLAGFCLDLRIVILDFLRWVSSGQVSHQQRADLLAQIGKIQEELHPYVFG
ncbi:hypothetical protein [Stutzerimonas chloritidismutans]|uniref:hypothetical protein n=1 Tax=Stutzerimonas chloritidismutans TaxID=203192 RepID=UPI0028A5BE9B|nr:hypothetical protein [Stutzerimonas chloritidismutans]